MNVINLKKEDGSSTFFRAPEKKDLNANRTAIMDFKA